MGVGPWAEIFGPCWALPMSIGISVLQILSFLFQFICESGIQKLYGFVAVQLEHYQLKLVCDQLKLQLQCSETQSLLKHFGKARKQQRGGPIARQQLYGDRSD
ncbi:uncharacterized protein N7518_010006 [Penicillium psychrosexuale]|uniref:uncharacterized protein n=1 Tax=Penicillium psychrosexuale TaxID=1002107 RepID=UPI002545871F|nr:uncharacterized protein N7518_010006 [Penicillium psychrosexuale]KAJ5781523.1 hypothetical protein N7518_010006 [Penicillium psychrosexuale]